MRKHSRLRLTHDEDTGVLPHSLCETFGTLLLDDVPPSSLARSARIESLGLILGVDKSGNRDFLMKSRLSLLTLDRRSVDDEVSEVTEKLLGTILGSDEVEKFGSIVDESGPGVSLDVGGVGEDSEQERNVGLDSANTELDKGTKHLATSDFESSTSGRALDEERVVVRLKQHERRVSSQVPAS